MESIVPEASDDETREDAARRIFGERARFYTTSSVHTDPRVLARVVELTRPLPTSVALDVATGTGHTAFALAPQVARVVATDITPEMLEEGRRLAAERGITNVKFQLADAHDHPFADGTFDIVTCRRAAHHFSRLSDALEEMKRLLSPGGRLVIDDRSVPDHDSVDRLMNDLDILHDSSHVRQYRPREWQEMLESHGFSVTAVEGYTRHRSITALTRDVDPDDAAEIHRQLEATTPEERQVLDLRHVDGELHHLHWFVTVAAELPV